MMVMILQPEHLPALVKVGLAAPQVDNAMRCTLVCVYAKRTNRTCPSIPTLVCLSVLNSLEYVCLARSKKRRKDVDKCHDNRENHIDAFNELLGITCDVEGNSSVTFAKFQD